jgi:predicted acetyltransferase
MRGLLDAMAERGYALSTLYPSTLQLYRSLGWELAGGHYRVEVPGRSLLGLMPADQDAEVLPGAGAGAGAGAGPPVRRAVPGDAERVAELLGAIPEATLACGPSTYDAATLRRWLADPDFFAYLAGDGFLGYGWTGGGYREITVYYLLAASARTARALWGIVASHSSVTRVVHATVGPADPVSWLTREPDVALRRHKAWMLRVLDARAAIARRGFPPGAPASVPLLLADPQRPANAGPHTLTVRDGSGRLESGFTGPAPSSPAPGPVRLGPRGFAALYAGTPAATLRMAGLLAGGDQGADEALDLLFAGQSYLLDYF